MTQKNKKWHSFKSIFSKGSHKASERSLEPEPEPEPATEYVFVIEPTLKEYKILGLDENLTDMEIKRRYRELIKQYHPDNGGDVKEFIKIKKAFEKIMQSRSAD